MNQATGYIKRSQLSQLTVNNIFSCVILYTCRCIRCNNLACCMVTYSIQLSHEVEHTLSKRTGLVTTQKNKCTAANQNSNIMIHNSCQQHCCSYNFSLLLHLYVDYTFTSLDLTVNIVDYYRKYA